MYCIFNFGFHMFISGIWKYNWFLHPVTFLNAHLLDLDIFFCRFFLFCACDILCKHSCHLQIGSFISSFPVLALLLWLGVPCCIVVWRKQTSLPYFWFGGKVFSHLSLSMKLAVGVPGPLAKESRVLLSLLLGFVCVHWHFQVVDFSNIQWDIWGKGKPKELTTLGPKVPGQFYLFSAHFNLLKVILYNVQGAWLYLLWGMGRSTSTPCSQKWKS